MTNTPTPDGTNEGRLSIQHEAESMLRHRLTTIDVHRNPANAIIKRDLTVTAPLREQKKELAEVVADFLGVAMLAWRTVEVREPLVFTVWGPMITLDHFTTLTDLLKIQAMAEAEKIPEPSGARRRKYVAKFTTYMAARLDVLRTVTAVSFSIESIRAVRNSHTAAIAALMKAHPDALFDEPESGFDQVIYTRPMNHAIELARLGNKADAAEADLNRLAGIEESS